MPGPEVAERLRARWGAGSPLGSSPCLSYIYNANGFLPFSVDYSFMLQANWLKFGMLMCFDMGKDNTEPENGKNP